MNAMKRGIELYLLWGGNVESSDVPGITTHIYDSCLALMTHKSTHIEVTLEQRYTHTEVIDTHRYPP